MLQLGFQTSSQKKPETSGERPTSLRTSGVEAPGTPTAPPQQMKFEMTQWDEFETSAEFCPDFFWGGLCGAKDVTFVQGTCSVAANCPAAPSTAKDNKNREEALPSLFPHHNQNTTTSLAYNR